MNKTEVLQFLDKAGIKYEKIDHKAVYNMQEMYSVGLPHPEAEAKNLFIRDDRKRNYFLLTVKGDKHVDLKTFQKVYGTRRLSFASDNDLMDHLGLIPGAVTPLGLLNDRSRQVSFYLDVDFFTQSGLVGVHPNDNTATVWIKADDLIRIVREHGNPVFIAEFPENSENDR